MAYGRVAYHLNVNENGLFTGNLLDTPLLNDGMRHNFGPYNHPRNYLSGKYYTINYFKRKFYTEFLTGDQLPINYNGNYPGKNGRGVNISHGADKANDSYWAEFHKYEFNVIASEKIPLNREVPKKLTQKCYEMKYPLNLPNASIIIVFHNEANSTLFRTMHSAYTRSPLYLIEEIILVDDFSDLAKYRKEFTQNNGFATNTLFLAHLGESLEKNIQLYPNVKIIRQPKRVGLTYSKITGAKNAKGSVLVFLDSHCECYDGWLEPLLYSIFLNPHIAVTPVIDVIHYKDFSISNNVIDYANIGVFNFKLDFNWKNVEMPYNMILKSPTMAGGLFAMDREFFFKSGSYDDGMGFWGGENLEMSFRLWTCAEGIYIHLCSIVGHVFRDHSPHSLPSNSVLINKVRVAEVWLDEFKPAFYQHYAYAKHLNYGNISSRIELRKNLNCKSFRWYLDNIATMVKPPDVQPYASGSLSTPNQQNFCVDSYGNEGPVRVVKCHKHGGNQHFIFNHQNEIRSGDLCFDSMGHTRNGQIHVAKCHGNKGNQQWFHKKYKSISSSIQFDSLCLQLDDTDSNKKTVKLDSCDTYNTNQIWIFSEYGEDIPL